MKKLFDEDEYIFRFDIGISQPSHAINTSNIDHILKLFANHYLISSVRAELDQLLSGMGVLGVIDLIRSNPNKMHKLLVYSTPKVLSTDDMMQLFPPKYSPVGSNRRETEEEAMMFWVHLLQMIECKHSYMLLCIFKSCILLLR